MPTLVSATHPHSGRGHETEANRSIHRTRQQQNFIAEHRLHHHPSWEEPGQAPEFEEFTLVLKGTLRLCYEGGEIDVTAGQAVIAHAGEWVKYSTPADGGAEYIAVCLPAFSMETVHRDA